MRIRLIGLSALGAFVATVVVANWLVDTYGIVPVGFGLEGPAAVYVVGAAFLLRDVVQRALGRVAALAAIAVGAALSVFVSPAFALASGVAFLVSELADFAVYSPLERRNLAGAVVASNVVGAVVDSLVFLWLAFGALTFLPGQIVGKLWVTAVAAVVLVGLRRRVPRVVGNGRRVR